MSTLRKAFWNVLWNLGVPIQCRSKYELDKGWYTMAKRDINITTNWSFEYWEYRIKRPQ